MKNCEILKGIAFIIIMELLIAGAAGALWVTMTKAQQKEIRKEVDDISLESENIIGESEKEKEKEKDIQSIHDKNLSDRQMYGMHMESELPIVNSNVKWKDYTINLCEAGIQKDEGDLDPSEVVEKSVKHIKNIAGTDITEGEVGVTLCNEMLKDFGKENNFGHRRYDVEINAGKKGIFSILMNAVTGEIFRYDYTHASRVTKKEMKKNQVICDGINSDEDEGMGFSEEEVQYEEEKEKLEKELEKVKPQYDKIAKTFYENVLGLEKLYSSYSISTATMASADGGYRYVIVLYCKTQEGDIVEMCIDQISKDICIYEINPKGIA